MKRRDFMKTVGAGAAALAMTNRAAAAPARRPNLLLYVTDDQGMDDAGCYGHPVIRTPGLDMLARHGTRFTHAFCTTASCSPSRSVILTGQYNHANGQYGLQHGYHHFSSHDTVRSLPVMLAEAGYRTACAGKFHVAPEAAYRFELQIGGGAPLEMAENCRKAIETDDNRPFFLYMCTTEPHRPFRRDGADPVSPEEVVVPPYLPDTPECREELAQYCMSVQRGDSGLKRVLELLQETGHWDDTVVLCVSDNGIPFPGAKTTVYDPGIRLPCVIRDPAVARQGGVCNAMITWADITPTLLDYAGGAPAGADFHGRSFRAALSEEDPEGWDEVYASHTFHEVTMYYPMRVVRTRRHKLIWNIAHGLEYPFASDLWRSSTWQGVLERGDTVYGKRTVDAYLHRPRFELYDLQEDPDEVRNLAEDPQHAAVLAELQAKLRAFQERTKDPWLLKWDRE
ncbi:MAG TPA: sulfatase [Candidatus Hydrogenedentes bacterium]|nr:sulfatase [Candidatus Hydrogenedentota bacterium]